MKGQSTIKALQLIDEKEITNGRQFAFLMWPDSEAWQHSSNGGRGSQRGKGMWLAGGSFLGRLKKAGLITGSNGRKHNLTPKGKALLKGNNDER